MAEQTCTLSMAESHLIRFIRLPQVVELTTLSRSTVWRKVADGTFPKPLKLSIGITVWRLDAVQEWMEQQEGTRHDC